MTDQIALPLYDFSPACIPPEPDELRDLARLDGVPDQLFRLITGDKHRPNLLSECADIRQLLTDGYTLNDIAAATGLNQPALKRRLRLENLIPELRGLYEQGGATNAVLEACAKLPEPVQLSLAETANANGKLTSGDVSNAKRARAQAAVATFPDDLFNPEPAQSDWRALARENVQNALSHIPSEESELRQAITSLYEKLSAPKGNATCEPKTMYRFGPTPTSRASIAHS